MSAAIAEPQEPVRILLVDDHAPNLIALQAVLEPLGQELVLARSGDEALQRLSEQDFALVLMDVQMPVLDGFQTVEVIRKREQLRHLPVVFLTAIFRDKESAARGYALGAVDFIMKPFEPEIIRAKVGAFVALYQHNEQLKRQQRQITEEISARRSAELAARAQEEFIAILGHDLRNPLSAILMVAEKHGRSAAASEPCRDASSRVVRSGRRMSRLISDVVDFTRSRLGGGIPLDRSEVDMAELCRLPLDELRTIYPDREIAVRIEGDVRGWWDSDRVLQVVANLVGNAAEHSDDQGTPIRVSVVGAGDTVVLDVHNFGGVIPTKKLDHLFEPFHRGEDRTKGLGLGLYIVDQIVRAHGGSVTCESAAATGTKFTVRWPRRHQARAAG